MVEQYHQLVDWFESLSWGETLLLTGGMFVVMFVLSLAAVSCVLVRLPATYFQKEHPHAFADCHPVVRWLGLIAKNLLGFVLVVIGIILSLPGVPGQGALTILIGLMLIDFPGKRALELRMVRQRQVYAAVNRLRARFGKPPLVLDEPDDHDTPRPQGAGLGKPAP